MNFNIVEKDTLFRNHEIRVKAAFRFAHVKYVDEITEELHRIIHEYQAQNNYDVRIEPVDFCPPVYNDEQESEDACLLLKQLIGENAVPVRHEFPPHGWDDFARFQHELSCGLFFFLGMANPEKGIMVGMHQPNFDIDEDCLAFGVKTMSMFLFHMMQSSQMKR